MSQSKDVDDALAEVSDGIEDELNTILPGNDPLGGLHAVHEGGTDYSVLSSRNGAPSYHLVELGRDLSCTCEDFQYNRDGREPCAHIVKAVLADHMEPENLAVRELLSTTATVSQAARQAEQTVNELETGLAKLRDAQAGQAARDTPDTTSDTTDSSSAGSAGPDPAEAADKLQSAYDDVVEDMKVQHHEDLVWVQTGKDTPDTLPGPGNVEVFQAFLQNADAVTYVHDDHELADVKPGEWWKNAIEPSDVDSYISEVLE